MATAGRLVGSILHGSQENQISLASLNFDFSLVKLEAPAEYQALGASLSPLRRKAAEQGYSHVTARKLGALFEQLLPSTPRLLKAYGSRASEIAKDPKLKANPAYLANVFPEHAGFDGTSIWAAATSGKGAIEMHLLACMLARIWTTSEATSIWVELVEERKRELSRCDPSEPLHLSSMAAAQVDVTRNQLAEWDNSARSWLRTADEVKQSKQKQLMLILRNVCTAISVEHSTYRSVLNAWISALTMMEKTISGTAQRVENGALLLGLSCWHLYPDLNVFGNKIVIQNDPLIAKNGVVTIGVETSPAQQTTGPYWSLPLAHLKHYGTAERVQRTLTDDSERLTLDEYLAVALGSFFANWEDPAQHMQEYSEIVLAFVQYLRNWCEEQSTIIKGQESDADAPYRNTRRSHAEEVTKEYERRAQLVQHVQQVCNNTFSPLEHIAQSLVGAMSLQRDIYARLVKLGHRRASNLLDNSASLFGLNTHDRILATLESTESRVAYLRRVASNLAREHKLEPCQMCIVYSWTDQDNERGAFSLPDSCPPIQGGFIYASALPVTSQRKKRNASGSLVRHTVHHRWINWNRGFSLNDVDNHFRSIQRDSEQDEFCSIDLQSWTNMLREPARPGASIRIGQIGQNHISVYNQDETEDDLTFPEIDPLDSFDDWFGKPEFVKPEEGNRMLANYGDSQPYSTSEFKMFFGLKNSCALYLAPALLQRQEISRAAMRSTVSPSDLKWALGTPGRISVMKLSTLILGNRITHSVNLPAEEQSMLSALDLDPIHPASRSSHDRSAGLAIHDSSLNSLRALASVKNVYSQLHGCTIAMKAVYKPLSNSRWHRLGTHAWTGYLSRSQMLAMLVAMETGNVDLDPELLKSVMAMASGDKIFLVGPLVSDPFDHSDAVVKAIRGNLGKPGIGLLIPPPDPMIRGPEDANWRVIDHAKFDGKLTDCFPDTSLHLSLTNYTLPIGEQFIGRQDVDLKLLEAAVSVHDRGKWIGDLHLPEALGSCVRAVPLSSECTHRIGGDLPPEIIAVDNWNELLDPPKDSYIVRAFGNWLARLSAACLIAQRGGRRVTILPDKETFCWQCVREGHIVGMNSLSLKSYVYVC